ncbi:AAA family ATPase [Algivirga pacifica]|uniref:AAA domain-containing protein n=1 Tax=Algivirga pacifica TaxID=1162670 RepID=A0ABP9DFX1_9BACT
MSIINISHTNEKYAKESITKAVEEQSVQDSEYMSLSYLHRFRITHQTQIPEIVPMITIRESTFAIKGDISFVAGLPKAGKTSIAAFMLATALMEEISDELDTLEIRSVYAEGKPVIYIDTEQPNGYTDKVRKTVCHLLGVEQEPSNLHIYNFRTMTAPQRLKAVLSLMKEYPDTHLWLIDGIADLVSDPNNAEESFQVINTMMGKAEELQTAIVLYLHLNGGNSDKLRGHLGSEADRKCGGAITVKKKEGIHQIEARMIRGSEDFEPVYFGWDKTLHRVTQLSGEQKETAALAFDKETRKRQQRQQLALACFKTGAAITHKEFVKRCMEKSYQVEVQLDKNARSIGESTAKKRIKEMIEYAFVYKREEDGMYMINEMLLQPAATTTTTSFI